MTQIGVLTIDVPTEYRWRQYDTILIGLVDRDEDLHALRELFAKSREGTAIHDSLDDRPWGEDMDNDQRNTQYVQFTHGDRPISGWYLLRSFAYFGDETPEGHDVHGYLSTITLFFLGTNAFYVAGFVVKDMEDVEDEIEDNDWGI